MQQSLEAASMAVIQVLQEVTGCSQIRLDDDFYLIGGHSLLILQVIRGLRREFGLDLDPVQFSVNSQVAALITACRPTPDSLQQGSDG